MAADPPEADYNEIVRGLSLIHFNETYEVRALTGIRNYADNGYFRDARIAANAIVNSDHGSRTGIYSTINGVDPDCYARAADCITGQSGGFTSDKEIPLLNWLILDIDAKRRSGISATEGEKGRSTALSLKIIDELNFLHGFPRVPMLVDSGNGNHILYRLWSLHNNPDNVSLIQRVLRKLAEKYDTDGAHVDISMFNPSRIVRIPGTVARKGSHTPDRPHRRSCIITEHDPLYGITREQLLRIGGEAPVTTRTHGILAQSYRYPPDEVKWRRLNEDAKMLPDLWVPILLEPFNPRKSSNGFWRISSKALGREDQFEEGLSIGVGSITDFGPRHWIEGDDGSRTPISILAEYCTAGDKTVAAQVLADTLGLPLTEFDRSPLGPPQGLDPLTGTPPAQPAALPLTDAAGGYTPALLHFTPLTNIASVDSLVRDPLIPNWVDGVSLLAADPKTGKTFLGVQMAICVAMGWPFLNNPIVEPCKVWYVALEDNQPNMVRRFKGVFRYLCWQLNQQWSEELEVYLFSRINIHAPGLEATDQMVTLEGALPQFARILDENPDYKFVIVDPFLLIKGNNVTGDIVQQEYLNFRRLMVPFTIRGVYAIVLHHTNKKGTGDTPMNALSGTQALRACAEVIHVMAKMRIGAAESDVIEVHTEMRNAEHEGLKFIKRLKNDNTTGFVSIDKNTAMAPMEEEVELALAYIQSTSHAPQNAASIAKGAKLDAGRIFRILQVLVDRGEIDKYGEKYGLIGIDLPHREPGKTGPDDVKWRVMTEHVLNIINASPERSMSNKDIENSVVSSQNISPNTYNVYIRKMVKEGLIINISRGVYGLPTKPLPDWL